jgi:uncharacterized protein (TIGR00255 family)
MTGFGKAVVELPKKKITIEIKSLNSKQLDLSLKVAPQYRDLEAPIRALISAQLERGKVDFSLVVETSEAAGTPHLNVEAVEAYKVQIDALAQQMGEPVSSLSDLLPTLLRLPDVVQVETPVVEEAELDRVMAGVREAVSRLVDFRRQEGEMLYKVFASKIANITALLEQVTPYEQEHGTSGQGKKLGFIAQEMGREINTLGSKANHAELQRIVVRMKDELEQIKEQVLNAC